MAGGSAAAEVEVAVERRRRTRRRPRQAAGPWCRTALGFRVLWLRLAGSKRSGEEADDEKKTEVNDILHAPHKSVCGENMLH